MSKSNSKVSQSIQTILSPVTQLLLLTTCCQL